MARILLVEDDQALRGILRRQLERGGHEVAEASDGQSGRLALAMQAFDVVVTDMYMPDEDGLRLLRHVRCTVPRTPVVTMSGADDLQDVALAAGAAAALRKPFTLEELLEAVRAALQGRDVA